VLSRATKAAAAGRPVTLTQQGERANTGGRQYVVGLPLRKLAMTADPSN